MPTLFRLLRTLALIALVGYGVLYGLANFVAPKQTGMTVEVPLDDLEWQ